MEPFECLSKIIRSRRSIRKFNDTPLDTDLVREIIDTASHAPSNNNRQGWKFYVVTDLEIKTEIARLIDAEILCNQNKSKVIDNLMASYKTHFVHFKNAPVLIVCCFIKPNQFQKEIFEQDQENQHMTGELISLSLVIQNMLLLAESRNIGTLVMTSPLVACRGIKKKLDIPNKLSIGAFVCMGYYDEKPPPPRHYNVERIIVNI